MIKKLNTIQGFAKPIFNTTLYQKFSLIGVVFRLHFQQVTYDIRKKKFYKAFKRVIRKKDIMYID